MLTPGTETGASANSIYKPFVHRSFGCLRISKGGTGRGLRRKESRRVGSQPLPWNNASDPRVQQSEPQPLTLLRASVPPSPDPVLTFSVSRSFTVGNGVLVDILRASQAAQQRCKRGWGWGRVERSKTRRCRSVAGSVGGARGALHPLLAGGKYRKTAAFHRSIAARQNFFPPPPLCPSSFTCLCVSSPPPSGRELCVCVLPPR